MENQPNQPQKGGKKALWILLAIVILAVIGYGVYAYVSNNTNSANNVNTSNNINQTVSTNTASNSNSAVNANGNVNSTASANTNSATNANIDTSGWKTYENNIWNFSFRYPREWSVIHDQLPTSTNLPDGTGPDDNLLVGLVTGGSQNNQTKMDLIINPSGFGPIFPDLIYTIQRTSSGFAVIDEKSISTSPEHEPGFYQIQAISSSDPIVFDLFFNTANENSDSWPSTVTTILSTFRFTN